MEARWAGDVSLRSPLLSWTRLTMILTDRAQLIWEQFGWRDPATSDDPFPSSSSISLPSPPPPCGSADHFSSYFNESFVPRRRSFSSFPASSTPDRVEGDDEDLSSSSGSDLPSSTTFLTRYRRLKPQSYSSSSPSRRLPSYIREVLLDANDRIAMRLERETEQRAAGYEQEESTNMVGLEGEELEGEQEDDEAPTSRWTMGRMLKSLGCEPGLL